MTSTDEGTSYVADDGGLDDKFNVDPPQEADPNGVEVALFSEPELVPSEPEDVEGGLDEEEEDPIQGSTLDSGDLEVGKKFSSKDSFLGALKQRSINHGVNYNVVKFKSEKFEAKCAMQDGVSQNHPKMDLGMIASLILLILKADPRTSVLERYVSGCMTEFETVPAYYNDRLLRGCQMFKRLFWSFKQCRDAFVYYKPLVQIDGTFMYGGYTHLLLLVVVQDGGRRILPIVFAITHGESADDWDFFLSRLRRHVRPQPDICIILDRGIRILAAIE
ncbi:uncharacterized protein LOC108459298 [Gossypium arboreum]|uniref:uncharacterized protein LOC108459298 n=1 Tax=Gossypium arboreum TaxID=29729 RepID=UPI0008192D12|nr:uncharacterized protein LOC108459298 [Gossypium arboreum]